jgi:hypothetical protein
LASSGPNSCAAAISNTSGGPRRNLNAMISFPPSVAERHGGDRRSCRSSSSSALTLTALDFLGFGLPPGSPSLGELLSQAKANVRA